MLGSAFCDRMAARPARSEPAAPLPNPGRQTFHRHFGCYRTITDL